MIYGDSNWKPKKKAVRDVYFSHSHGPKVKPSGKEYRPKVNYLEAMYPKREIKSLENPLPDIARPQIRYEDPEMQARELAARQVKFPVMAGHKQGYELVTDPEMIKLMGRKQV